MNYFILINYKNHSYRENAEINIELIIKLCCKCDSH